MRIVAVGILALALIGCSGSGGLSIDPDDLEELASLFPVGSADPSGDFVEPVGTPSESTPESTPGTWTGTIALHGVINLDESGSGDNDQDPNSAYYQTYMLTKTTQSDVTDTFTLTGEEPGSLEYGIPYVSFSGTAENSGSESQNQIYIWDKQNSACTWTEENGHESSGSWSGSGEPEVSLEFQQDGSYSVFLRVSPDGDYPTLDTHSWLENSDISANCEEVEPGYDTNDEGSPLFTWVEENYGDMTTDGSNFVIEGEVGAGSSVVEGSQSWDMDSPDGFTITADWRFERSAGPIVLPHD